MFNHVMLGTNDIERAARFYEAVLRVLGLEAQPASSKTNSGHLRLFFRHDGNTLGITQPINDQPATAGNGSTVAFKCDSRSGCATSMMRRCATAESRLRTRQGFARSAGSPTT